MRERMPVAVWYDILKGKLAELTLHNYCKLHEISTNLEYPSFEVLGKDSSVSNGKSQLHDLSINDRKKEIKSGEYWHKYITLKASYFEDGQYKYGNPDDIIFVSISLCGLHQAKALLEETILEQEKDKSDSILHSNELLSHTFRNKRYKCNMQAFMNDFLVKAITCGCDLEKIGFIAATEKRKGRNPKNNEAKENRGEFTVLGEMPICDFLKTARLVKPKYIHGLPDSAPFKALARDYMSVVEKPLNKELSFKDFVCRNFRIKKLDDPTFVWLKNSKIKPGEQLEESGVNLDELESIRQASDFEYVITPIELLPLRRTCQIDEPLTAPLSLSQELNNLSKSKARATALIKRQVKVQEKLPASKIEANFRAGQSYSYPSPRCAAARKPVLRSKKCSSPPSSPSKSKAGEEFAKPIIAITSSVAYQPNDD